MRYVLLLGATSLLSACAPQFYRLEKDLAQILKDDALVADRPVIDYASPLYSFVLFQAADTTVPILESGTLTSCTVSPALPNGLTLNLNDCRIHGTPALTLVRSAFIVTPSGPSGNGDPVSIEIEVANIVPNIAYSSASYIFALSNPMTTSGVPTNTGGLITNCTVDQPLPTGLTLSTSTCAITGTPTVITAADTYVITPTNGVGSGTPRTITLEVENIVPNISFSLGSYTFDVNSGAVTTTTPANTGGAITSCASDIVLPAGLSINQTTCEITGTPNVVTASADYVMTPANGVGTGTPRTITLEVVNVPPQITYGAALYTFDLNDASATTSAPTHLGGAITGCLVSPALPAGLNLNTSTCEISGTPTTVTAVATYTITPSNGVGNGISRTLTIEASNIVPNIAFAGSPYRFNIHRADSTGTPANTGGAITNCIISPTLPTGLTIDTSNCTISGTPTVVSANTTYTVTPSNAIGNGIARTIDVETPNIAPAIVYSPDTRTLSLFADITGTITPNNTGGPITSCTSDIALPSGLSLNQTTCSVEGTPDALQGLVLYAITATNAIGSSSATNLRLRVNNVVPHIAYSSSSYSFNVNTASASSGAPTNTGGAITSCNASPALPNGLTLNQSTCEISGTPTDVRPPTTHRITPSNGVGSGAYAEITIEIANIVPSIAFAGSPFSWTENTSVSTGDPSNTGGAITSCAIFPALSTAGLTFNTSTCKINGTPTATLTATNYTITASNAIGSGSGVTISLEVVSACPSGSQVLTYTGSTQNFIVPANCTTVTIKAWGAGGGAHASSGSGSGGGGGFAQSTINVTGTETLTIAVGGRGGYGNTGCQKGYNGGALGGINDARCGGGGGGASSVLRAGTLLLVAGGGGGAGKTGGGPGGGANGGAGEDYNVGPGTLWAYGGGGGTSSSGGAGGTSGDAMPPAGQSGTLSSGGSGSNRGSFINGAGGGGGGYYGGGGGGASDSFSAGGGGGSSYATGTSISLISGSGQQPANNGVVEYVAGIGVGGVASSWPNEANANGGNGRVVITWGNDPVYISAVNPPSTLNCAPTSITIDGYGFKAGATVKVQGEACTNVNVQSANRITCDYPALQMPSSMEVEVKNPDTGGASFTLSGGSPACV